MSSTPPNATPNEMALYNQVQSLTAQLAQISAQLAASHTPPSPKPTGYVKINSPSEFKGSREGSRPFLGQCELVFSTRPDLYPNGSLAQVNYAASYLRDHAFLWFQSWRTTHSGSVTYSDFKSDFLMAFGETDLKAQSTRELNRLTQKASVTTYVTTFNRLSANTGLNDEALQFIFNQGLKDEITELLLIHESFVNLSDLQAKAIKIDNRLFNLRQRKKASSSSQSSSGPRSGQRDSLHNFHARTPMARADTAVPMQIDSTFISSNPRSSSSASRTSPISKEEKLRRRNNSLCGYCGETVCGGFPDLSKCSKLAGRPGFQPRRTA